MKRIGTDPHRIFTEVLSDSNRTWRNTIFPSFLLIFCMSLGVFLSVLEWAERSVQHQRQVICVATPSPLFFKVVDLCVLHQAFFSSRILVKLFQIFVVFFRVPYQVDHVNKKIQDFASTIRVLYFLFIC